MSNPTRDRPKLLPHQASFVEQFCADKGHGPYLLQSGIGLGSHTTVAHIIERIMCSNETERVLVLSPSPLQFQMQKVLSDLDVSCQVIDRFRYRELVDASDSNSDIWPRNSVSILSIDFAKKQDILDSLCKVSWTLIIVLEAHGLSGQRERALGQLVQCSPATRLLWVSPVSLEDDPRLNLTAFKVVRWNPHEITDASGNPLFVPQPANLKIVEIKRENSELELVEMIKTISAKLRGTDNSSALSGLITRSLASSPAAAEGILRRLRNRLAHNMPLTELTDFEEDPEDLEETNGESLPKDLGLVLQLLNTCLYKLESQTIDSKLKMLTSLVGDANERAVDSLCVLSSFRATVLYVQTRLEELGMTVNALHGSMSFHEQTSNMEHFRENGGVLVCTTPTLIGRDLPPVDSVFLYDLPKSRQVLQQLYGRFQRYGRPKPFTFIAFSDPSLGSDSILESFLRLAESQL